MIIWIYCSGECKNWNLAYIGFCKDVVLGRAYDALSCKLHLGAKVLQLFLLFCCTVPMSYVVVGGGTRKPAIDGLGLAKRAKYDDSK